jgi:hypothetical protein
LSLRYIHDVFGNCIGIARFGAAARELTIESINRLEHWPEHSLDDPSSPDRGLNAYPFAYDATDLPDIHSSMLRGHRDPERTLEHWSRRFLQNIPKVDAPNVLAAMTRGIHDEFKYLRRESGPPQSPVETLRSGKGTCRDFAVLMMEAVRTLGLAARFVSGYLHVPPKENVASTERSAAGTPMPGCAFFCRMAAGRNSIPPTACRQSRSHPRCGGARSGAGDAHVGTWIGNVRDYLGMDVEVQVTLFDEKPERGVAPNAPDRAEKRTC